MAVKWSPYMVDSLCNSSPLANSNHASDEYSWHRQRGLSDALQEADVVCQTQLCSLSVVVGILQEVLSH